MRWRFQVKNHLRANTAVLFMGILLVGCFSNYAYAAQNNCTTWVAHNSDCVSDGTCACVAAGTQLQISPPSALAFAKQGELQYEAPNPSCQQISNNTSHDVLVPFRYIDEWSLGQRYGFIGHLPYGVTVSDCSGAPVINFIANPNSISAGGSSTLTWIVTGGATSCTASGSPEFISAVSTTGSSKLVSPTTTTTYGLSCTNSKGTTTASTLVTVIGGAPIITFTANPTTINARDSSVLTWTVTGGATSCVASGDPSFTGPVSTNGGTQSVTPTVTTAYFIACDNSSGSTSSSATITVNTTATCGADQGASSNFEPWVSSPAGLCSTGSVDASSESHNGGNWNWTCSFSGSSTSPICSAPISMPIFGAGCAVDQLNDPANNNVSEFPNNESASFCAGGGVTGDNAVSASVGFDLVDFSASGGFKHQWTLDEYDPSVGFKYFGRFSINWSGQMDGYVDGGYGYNSDQYARRGVPNGSYTENVSVFDTYSGQTQNLSISVDKETTFCGNKHGCGSAN